MSPRAPLKIWCNLVLPEDQAQRLQTSVLPHQLVWSSRMQATNLTSVPDPLLLEADIAFGQPDPAIVISSPRLHWVHLTTAGYERYDRPDLRDALRARGAFLTNASSVFDEPCAQHVLAFMLAQARQLPAAWHNQASARAWPSRNIRAGSRLLVGQSALLLGFGAIARRIAQLLAPFNMNLCAVRRTIRGDEPIPTFPESHLPQLLPTADHVINCLPGGQSTRNFVSAQRIAQFRPGATYYSIGRGSTTDQLSLATALREGSLAAACLDVTDPEPLPPDHELWSLPNCFITPHTSGGHTTEMSRQVDHFLANLQAFTQATPLRDRLV